MAGGFIRAGERFGKLVVTKDRNTSERKIAVRCDCGREREMWVANLGGATNSCGQCHRRGPSNGRHRHGMAGSKIYMIWTDMVGRCTRPTHKRYASYGGRGITVCDRWLVFDNFYADMGDRPEGRSLDRRDNDAGYSPENCRWATLAEQALNRRPDALDGLARERARASAALQPRNRRIVAAYLAGAGLPELAGTNALSEASIRLILKQAGVYRPLQRVKAEPLPRRPRRKAQHGSRSKYRTGCRCNECREAENSYARERYHRAGARREENAA